MKRKFADGEPVYIKSFGKHKPGKILYYSGRGIYRIKLDKPIRWYTDENGETYCKTSGIGKLISYTVELL